MKKEMLIYHKARIDSALAAFEIAARTVPVPDSTMLAVTRSNLQKHLAALYESIDPSMTPPRAIPNPLSPEDIAALKLGDDILFVFNGVETACTFVAMSPTRSDLAVVQTANEQLHYARLPTLRKMPAEPRLVYVNLLPGGYAFWHDTETGALHANDSNDAIQPFSRALPLLLPDEV